MPRRGTLPESKLRKRRQRRVIRLSIVFGVLFLILAAALVGGTWLPFLRVANVAVIGAETVSSDRIARESLDLMSGRTHLVFPKNSIFFYPKDQLGVMFVNEFPEIKSLSIHAQDTRTIVVTLSERHASALWCGNDFSSTSPCYLLDGEGVVYGSAPEGSQAYLKYFGDAVSLKGATSSDALPWQYLSAGEFSGLEALVAQISEREQNDRVAGTYVDSEGNADLMLASGTTLKFLAASDPSDVLERLTLAEASDAFNGRVLEDFQYIDLRFGDKLYYKLR